MRSWLTYIFLLMVACGTVLTSCSDVLSEEGLGTCDDRTTVRLTISFGGDDDPMSRDVGSDQTPKDDDLDYTTEEQAEIVTGDVYALVVDANNKFLYRIKDLHLEEPDTYDNYYTRTLEGTMIQTKKQVRIVLLANLVQNQITVNNILLDEKSKVEDYIDGIKEETDVSTIYNKLIYNYDGATTPWTVTGNDARRIPMWGQSQPTTVPPTENIDLACYLYRAVAKVQIWVNNREGIDGFIIDKMEVMNVPSKGYCVSSKGLDTNSPHYKLGTSNDPKPYVAPDPYVPGIEEVNKGYFKTVTYTPTNTNITYNIDGAEITYNDATQSYSDMIYLPEHKNTDDSAIIIKVYYTFNGKKYHGEVDDEYPAGIIQFKENGEGARFDVIRNYSYIFNINKISEVTGKIYYVVDQWDNETIDIPPFK